MLFRRCKLSDSFRLTVALALIGFAAFYFYQIFPTGAEPVAISQDRRPPLDTRAILGRGMVLDAAGQPQTIDPATLRSWALPYYRSYTTRTEFRLDYSKVEKHLVKLNQTIARSPQNSRLAVDVNEKLYEQVPAQNGRIIDTRQTYANVLGALNRGENSATVAVVDTAPAIALAQLTNAGITDRLGYGQSNFGGSPSSRVHNIKVGAALFNGVLVQPGQEFSFNQWLGPVEAENGYQPELVIKNKQVVPEYGGGLCQISTTLFRAVMAAGLPITERHPHSLSVRYYNPQGYDATIYPGVSDLKFKNDTVSPIFIQSQLAGASLSFEIYGASDGRTVQLDGPHVYAREPGLKTWLKRVVTYTDGRVQKAMFYSNYRAAAIAPVARNPLE